MASALEPHASSHAREASAGAGVLGLGASLPVLKTRSLAGVRLRNISFRLLAIVTSLTAKVSSPFSIQKPAAPRL